MAGSSCCGTAKPCCAICLMLPNGATRHWIGPSPPPSSSIWTRVRSCTCAPRSASATDFRRVLQHIRLHRRHAACALPRSTCRRRSLFGAACAGRPAVGADALHNNAFEKMMKALSVSERREPETSVRVLIARRMEPERSGSSSQRPPGLSSRVAFCYTPALSLTCLVQGRRAPPLFAQSSSGFAGADGDRLALRQKAVRRSHRLRHDNWVILGARCGRNSFSSGTTSVLRAVCLFALHQVTSEARSSLQ
jgi:hypothetical protein